MKELKYSVYSFENLIIIKCNDLVQYVASFGYGEITKLFMSGDSVLLEAIIEQKNTSLGEKLKNVFVITENESPRCVFNSCADYDFNYHDSFEILYIEKSIDLEKEKQNLNLIGEFTTSANNIYFEWPNTHILFKYDLIDGTLDEC